jgi:hypothetical protein
MPALVAGIHDFIFQGRKQDVDGRVKPGHDEEGPSHACEARSSSGGVAHGESTGEISVVQVGRQVGRVDIRNLSNGCRAGGISQGISGVLR